MTYLTAKYWYIPVIIILIGLGWIQTKRLKSVKSERDKYESNQSALLGRFDSVNTRALRLHSRILADSSEIARLKGIKPKNIQTVHIIRCESTIDTVIQYRYVGIDSVRTVPIQSGCFTGQITLRDSAQVELSYNLDIELLAYRKRAKNWFLLGLKDGFRFGKYWHYRVELMNKCDSNMRVKQNLLIYNEK